MSRNRETFVGTRIITCKFVNFDLSLPFSRTERKPVIQKGSRRIYRRAAGASFVEDQILLPV